MSLTEIDDATYQRFYTDLVAKWIDEGLDLPRARSAAADEMERSFISTSAAFARESALDDQEEKEGDWTR